jgi:Ca-activated chloride channel family protein
MPSKFSLSVNGKEIKGTVLEKEEAKRLYEDIVRRMRDPALLEYYQNNLFRAKVFPIPSKKSVKVTMNYEYEPPRKGEFYEIFYPLKIQGITGEPIDNVIISFEIKSNLPLKQVFSPTHNIDISKEEKKAKGAYEGVKVKPGKDFVLYYSVAQEDIALSLLSYKKEEDGFFLLGISTPAMPSAKDILPKDIIFVIDVSGSMSGEKIEQAKKGLNFFVEHLNPEDNFNIIAFSSDVNLFKKELIQAIKNNIHEAKRFIEGIKAVGGTNINDALLQALKITGKERPSYILFLTDGLPTVGITSLEEIVKNVKATLKKERMIVFGVGYDVNTVLLDRLSQEAAGFSAYIEPGEDLELAISSVSTKIMLPAMENPEIEFMGMDVYKLHPFKVSDLFYGQDIIIAGRYKNAGKAEIILRGLKKDKKIVVEKGFDFTPLDEDLDFIPITWARKRVSYLLSEIRLHGESKELVDEIMELGKKYGIVTPYTSYLVREEERVRAPLAGVAPRALREEAVGKTGVMIAKELAMMEREAATAAPDVESIKQIGAKTFYLKGGGYVDAEYKEEMKTKEIKFGSAEYFLLFREYPQYARYFSLGKKITVVIEGMGYKIVE